MAFGKGSGTNNYPPGTRFLNFKIRTKDLPAPIFEVSEKQADGSYAIVDPKATHVSGDLINIVHKSNPNPKKPGTTVESVKATFHDRNAKEVYYVDIPYSYLGRNLMNSLLGLKTFGGLEVALYQSKPKPDAVNKTGFASVALRQNGELVYGRFKNEELPKIVKVTVGKEVHSDTSAIDAFFAAQIGELNTLVKAKTPEVHGGTAGNETTGSSSADTDATAGGQDDDSVPF